MMRKQVMLCVLTLGFALATSAQNLDMEAYGSLSFSFRNPGARALGMGGAFIALADDATAAEANPAGLSSLQTMEASIELSQISTSKKLPVSGHFPNVKYEEFDVDTTELTFASFVLPYGQDWRFAFEYRKSLSEDFQGSSARNNQLFPCAPDPITPANCTALLANDFDVPIDIDTLGVSAAWKHGDFSYGLTARYQSLDMNTRTSQVNSAGAEVLRKTQKGDDSDVTIVAGVRWAPTSKFGAGVVYKQGAEYDTTATFTLLSGSLATGFHVPDVYGGGIYYRPKDQWVVTADVVNVAYSNLIDNFNSITEQDFDSDNYRISDGTEIHIGTEYAIPSKSLALRAGYWLEPEHAIEYTGLLDSNLQRRQRIYFPGGEEQDHLAVGIGYITSRFSVDVAYDTASLDSTLSASVVWRFD